MSAAPWPRELKLSAARDCLAVEFESGERFDLPAELLRVESPSAEVQGHSPAQKQTVAGKRHVTIARIEPVGNYAVRLVFSDGHDTGIYSWAWLFHLGRDREALWAGYLKALADRGLSREG